MNILLVSQCSKKALVETRRIIDNYAERRGDRTWQTAITKAGLDTLRKLLKKNARRNTAVACHWIRSKNHTELLWIVGNQSKFNQQGAVPTNVTQRDVVKFDDENHWHSAEDIALLSAIAALFHDFGKANVLFQKKLTNKGKSYEPYRHEWVSLRMFQAFVAGQGDSDWLTRLANADVSYNQLILDNLITDHPKKQYQSPFSPKTPLALPPLARAIGWLILTHHKLPVYCEGTRLPQLGHIDKILNRLLSPAWISPQILSNQQDEEWGFEDSKAWTEQELNAVWDFKQKTPLLSKTWRVKAARIGKRALARPGLMQTDWLSDNFTLHLSRLSLMMADHFYSAHDATPLYQDAKYKVWANTDSNQPRNSKGIYPPKQRLDEHLVGVYRASLNIVRMLQNLEGNLPAIARHRELKKRAKGPFNWQNKAFDVAAAISDKAQAQGFFGVNMASTGKGKTLANARIMYGLSDASKGCRFSIALGLRTLTLQTGQALMQRLTLDDDDIAVLIGSMAVKQLFAENNRADKAPVVTGSESHNDLYGQDQYVRFEGSVEGPLKAWLGGSAKTQKLVNAPILVSTVDHLMPATESFRGGRQIAPMLRLLSADLVLDEIDDFDLADLPALCRLVNWAGLLGAKVLLSSATIAPALVATLFDAYASGRAQYRKVRGNNQHQQDICCAWFDEFNATSECIADKSQLTQSHQQFVSKRVKQLVQAPALRQAIIQPVSLNDAEQPQCYNSEKERTQRAIEAIANKVFDSIIKLHEHHGIDNEQGDKRISIGLVRMANINPMVAVAKALMAKACPADTEIHYCVYHSRFTLVVRNAIECQLDGVLNRKKPDAIWHHQSIKQALAASQAKNHLFVVLGSPVCEVGRDHDYDWAVVEPSSMRSIIQLAGRVQRHRVQVKAEANIHLLSHNFKALCGRQPAFTKPGFETTEQTLSATGLEQLLLPEQYQVVNAISRIEIPQALMAQPNQNLAAFEHQQLANTLSDGEPPACLWWQQPLSLTYEWQRRTKFRRSVATMDFVLRLKDEDDDVEIHKWARTGDLVREDYKFERPPSVQATFGTGVSIWGEFDYKKLIIELSETLEQDVGDTSMTFGSISLQERDFWFFDEVLGFYQAV